MRDAAVVVVAVVGALVLLTVLARMAQLAQALWARSLGSAEEDAGAIKCCHECWCSFTREQWLALEATHAPPGVDARRCSCGVVLEIDESDRDDTRPYTRYRGFS